MSTALQCFLQQMISQKIDKDLTAEVVLVDDNASPTVNARRKATISTRHSLDFGDQNRRRKPKNLSSSYGEFSPSTPITSPPFHQD